MRVMKAVVPSPSRQQATARSAMHTVVHRLLQHLAHQQPQRQRRREGHVAQQQRGRDQQHQHQGHAECQRDPDGLVGHTMVMGMPGLERLHPMQHEAVQQVL
ncbi:hypothetical protein RZS08_12610, partial [Arthrospira platensis SPKY1]|nr:hypothetical protein [Arthrospira platensis SPKY1]